MNPDTMTDEEFSRWMDTTEFPDTEEEEEIEVDGTEEEEFTEEAEEAELEQPEEESDNNGDEDEPEEVEEEGSEEAEEGTDGDQEEQEEEKPEDETKPAELETQPVESKTYRFKADGEEFEFTEKEMIEQFGGVFAKAVNYTKKTQALQKHRPMIDTIEQEKLTQQDLNFAVDLLKGNKEAIAELIKRHEIDTLELETDNASKYVPNSYGRSEVELNIQEITNEISKDPEYEVTHRVLTKDWDDDSWTEMTKKPQLIKLLHNDIKNGAFAKVNPIAKKLRMQDEVKYGQNMRSDIEYYKLAANIHSAQTEQEAQRVNKAEQDALTQRKIAEVKSSETSRDATKKLADKRKAAAPTKSNAGTKKSVNYLEEALNMSDDDYLKWMEKKLK